jgi:NADPH-dependent glutamate synthase beta subunit-like oxidoreductase
MMAERFRTHADKFAVASHLDVAALPDLVHGQPRAGSVRDRRLVYVDLMPPCNAGCPAGENIQAWLAHARAGRHEQPWRQLVADRVSHHPCESTCNRAHLDAAVSIHAAERFLAEDWATQERADHVSALREANSGAYGSH